MAPNWLGDLIMSTPLLDILRERVDGEIHVLVRDLWRPLLEDDPRIDALHTYDRRLRHVGVVGSLRLAADLRSRRYGAAFVVPPSFRAAAVAALAGIPKRVGWTGDGRRLLLSDRVARTRRGERHYCDEVADLWNRGAPYDGATTEPSLPAASRWPADARGGAAGSTVALAVGATYGDAKSWPPALAAGFAAECVRRGRRVLVLGDGAARRHADELGRHLGSPWAPADGEGPGVVDLVGATDLLQVAALCRDAALFVGNDSGLMHLAAALGTPTIGLFGSTNPDWTRPRGPRVAHIAVQDFSCSPCHLRECPKPEFCLGTISAEAVTAAADELLAGGSR